ncbi:capsular exopolysaccharide synthesis family protein [Branchiibius hedensis]|uniref:non-specific protein-tyrosine kinase n=1 Tax=Branchiibius hedensis TaxID=672460 RepID=A0A2Y8ZUF1_9MICO|nr:polysaccharide biosynthesis tyrosine autokinase [Branchiibius hedensis]PWJ25114.1 capsular exopolysaccharide synthesis family protein [Branchiibius hedensis]SSA33929.1 capsular exopolysaccharide family [Branchiibius hedensis]
MRIDEYYRILRRHWKIIVAATLAAIAVMFVWDLFQPKVYQASSSGFVTAGQPQNLSEAAFGDQLAKSRATSYVDVAQSRAVAQQVIDDLNLQTTPAALINQISVDQPTNTVLLRISANASSPEQAQAIANAWVKALAAQVAKIEGSGANSLRINVQDPAQLPSSPISPNTKLDLIIAGIVGLLGGIGLAMLRSQMDGRLRDPNKVREQFGVPVLGSVPQNAQLSKSERTIPIVVGEGVRTDTEGLVTAEAFLKMRTSLQYMNVDRTLRVIVVSSPNPDDGKSTVAANIAASVALSGEKTLLVDADLRRPSIATGFGLLDGAGLAEVLAHRVDLADVLQDAPETPNLSVLAAGLTPPNPSEMLGSKAMKTLLDDLAKEYFVVIDAPPLLPVTDAAILGTQVDGVVVVICAGKTLDHQLETSLRSLHEVHADVLGVVMNKLSQRDMQSYYGSGYGTYYGRDLDPPARSARERSVRRQRSKN